MTTIRIRPLAADAEDGGALDSTVEVRLVNAHGRPIIGLRTTDGAPVTCYASREIAADDEPWEVDLTPQSQIVRPNLAESYYLVSIRAAHRTEKFRVQVPSIEGTVDLVTLVGASAMDEADINAVYLIDQTIDGGGASD